MNGNFKFSCSGNYFLMAGKQPTSIFVYDSSDIMNLIDLIKEKKFIKKIDDLDLKELRKISFSPEDRVMILAFNTRIKFYLLSDPLAVTPYKIVDIPINYGKFNLILTAFNFYYRTYCDCENRKCRR